MAQTTFSPGQQLATMGLDTWCRPVLTAATFHSYQPADRHGHDCVIRTSSGFLMLAKSGELFLTADQAK